MSVRIRMLAVLLAGIGLLAGPRAGLAEPVRVALLPVVVHMSDAQSAPHVSSGIGDMLASRLERSGEIQVIRATGDDGSTTRPASAIESGRAMGADWVVFGSFTQFGVGASLDIQCAAIAGTEEDARRVFIQSGEMSQIIPKLDELVTKVNRHVLGRNPAAEQPAGEAPPAAGDNAVEELRRRVDALERAVYLEGKKPAASGEPTAAAAGSEAPAAGTEAAAAGSEEASAEGDASAVR
jgi:hypothetical protein